MKTTPCRKCDAPMVWAKTEKGRPMPFDREPSEEGTFALTKEASGVVRARHKSKAPEGADLYMPHHATCPFADEFRR